MDIIKHCEQQIEILKEDTGPRDDWEHQRKQGAIEAYEDIIDKIKNNT